MMQIKKELISKQILMETFQAPDCDFTVLSSGFLELVLIKCFTMREN